MRMDKTTYHSLKMEIGISSAFIYKPFAVRFLHLLLFTFQLHRCFFFSLKNFQYQQPHKPFLKINDLTYTSIVLRNMVCIHPDIELSCKRKTNIHRSMLLQ